MESNVQPIPYAMSSDYVLYNDDCTSTLAHFAPESVDMVFADPPYFLSNGGTTCKNGKRVSVDKDAWDASRGFEGNYSFHLDWLEGCRRVLKPSGTLWVSGTHHNIFQVGFILQDRGFKILNVVTWFKPNAAPNLACRYFTHSTEFLIWAAPADHKPLRHTFNYAEMKAANGGKQMRDMWSIPPPGASEKTHGKHPTQKPLALLERVVAASTKPGDVVLDPFAGSGTTGVAAVKLGRRFAGIELDPQYIDLTKRRLDAAKGDEPCQPAMKAS